MIFFVQRISILTLLTFKAHSVLLPNLHLLDFGSAVCKNKGGFQLNFLTLQPWVWLFVFVRFGSHKYTCNNTISLIFYWNRLYILNTHYKYYCESFFKVYKYLFNYFFCIFKVCDGQPTKATRMMQAEEAVSRIKVSPFQKFFRQNRLKGLCQLIFFWKFLNILWLSSLPFLFSAAF